MMFATRTLVTKKRQKEDCDRHHRVRTLPPIPDDSEVWTTSDKNQIIPGRVTGKRGTPRSYMSELLEWHSMSNHYHLHVAPSTELNSSPQPQNTVSFTPPQTLK